MELHKKILVLIKWWKI